MISRIWRRLRGWHVAKDATLPPSGVLVHDPAASRAHDLDNPFFDAQIQARLAEVIANAALKKQPSKDAG
jgi:hypothetical protein